MIGRAFIFAAGAYKAEDILLYKRIKYSPNDIIICADGGFNIVSHVGVTPNVVIGDMDSIRHNIPKTVKKIVYPKVKDKTDLHLCVDYAIESGYKQIILLGALGGRVDHSMASLIMLRYILEKGAEGLILTQRSKILIINNNASLKREEYTKISLIPLTDKVEGVVTTGLLYPLQNKTLLQTNNLGISNEFSSNIATIKIKTGLLYIICEME